MAARQFPYEFDRRYAWIWFPLGARPGKDMVSITPDRRLVATFGRFRVDTPLSNISQATLTGPYKWWRAIGIRGSHADSGITFGTTARGGVCILFEDPIPQVIPPSSRHAGLTVTVADRDGLVDALSSKPGRTRGKK